MKYSETVMDHFMNPRNVGEISDADGHGMIGNPSCGDIMEMFVNVKNDHIDDIKFKTFGCGAAIAVSSMVTELAKGKLLEDAMNISKKDIAEALGGLPPKKMHCSNLGTSAMRLAIANYWEKNGMDDKIASYKHLIKEAEKENEEKGHDEKSCCSTERGDGQPGCGNTAKTKP